MAVTGVALAGCSDSGPSDLDTPEVVWPDGAPKGEFEDRAEVQALREAMVQQAVAWNALDYSDPDLIFRWGFPLDADSGVSAATAQSAEEIGDDPDAARSWTAFGPAPFAVYEVVDGEDGAAVEVCVGSRYTEWEGASNALATFVVTMFPDGSSHIETDVPDQAVRDEFSARCDAEELAQGYFDPEPDVFDGGRDDVKPPAAAEQYGFDNVS